MTDVLRIGALISGGGRTLANIADHVESGALRARVAVVVASRPCPGAERARSRGLDVRVVPGGEAHDEITRILLEARVGLVCLCGYLRWFRVDEAFVDRAMNIHPALLPRYGGRGMYGERVHRAVLAAGDRVSGCTVHYVDDRYDHGPIILQRTCPVLPGDDDRTLAARVFAEECIAYPEAIRLFAGDRLRVQGNLVKILPPPS